MDVSSDTALTNVGGTGEKLPLYLKITMNWKLVDVCAFPFLRLKGNNKFQM
jgi:hypothetical protein